MHDPMVLWNRFVCCTDGPTQQCYTYSANPSAKQKTLSAINAPLSFKIVSCWCFANVFY